MPFVSLGTLLPDLEERETRTLTTFQDGEFPAGTYGLLELYCDEPGCDCRRVVLNVVSPEVQWRDGMPLATINFGWEDDDFYRRWASFPLSDEDLDELRGPALMSMNPQSPYAPALLEAVRPVLADEVYAARLVRHYELFRQAVESGKGRPRRLSMRWTDERRKRRRKERKKARPKKGRGKRR